MVRFCVKFRLKKRAASAASIQSRIAFMPDKPSSEVQPDAAAPVYQARTTPGGQGFDAPSDLPLLLAAERAGVAVVSSCRNGTCRACISQLASGRVVYRIDWPGLSLDEKQAGCILPCVAYPASDVVFERI